MPFYGAGVEYALHTVFNLALAPAGTAPSARDLADFQKLPVPYVQKLLTQLEKAGIVTGAEGVRGGWRLARAAGAITVLDVTDAAKGEEELFKCRDIRARCALWQDGSPPPTAVSGVCSIHAVMLTAEQAMRRELAAHTVADLISRVAAKSPPTFSAVVGGWFDERYANRRSGGTTGDSSTGDDDE